MIIFHLTLQYANSYPQAIRRTVDNQWLPCINKQAKNQLICARIKDKASRKRYIELSTTTLHFNKACTYRPSESLTGAYNLEQPGGSAFIPKRY